MGDYESSTDADDTLSRARGALADAFRQDVAETVLPSPELIRHKRDKLHQTLPDGGLGISQVTNHLDEDIVPALNTSSRSRNYYGFVTGGTTPAAALADNYVTLHDQNVQVRLPDETIATDVEDAALSLLCQLLGLDPCVWSHRTFTTGATASNVLGLACAREWTIARLASMLGVPVGSVADLGFVNLMRHVGVEDIQVLTTVPHSSLGKAASIVGLGRLSVKDVGIRHGSHKFDMDKLERALQAPRVASIVVISCGEVNTGFYATESFDEMKRIRDLCARYDAWIHVDGAFGLLARILRGDSFRRVRESCAGIELADSITGDGHKLLNVPYDCGFFLSRNIAVGLQVFQNANAAYLQTASQGILPMTPSPLDIGIENSRRFRALPVYSTLLTYGRTGYEAMLKRQVSLARRIASLVCDHPEYELLPESSEAKETRLERIFIIVLFRAKDETLNTQLVRRINATRRMYVSGTSWASSPACRIAISNWRVDEKQDFIKVREVLDQVVRIYVQSET